MLTSPTVTIVVNGAIVAGARPARVAGGRVLAPITPVVVRIAARVVYDSSAGTVELDANGVRIIIPVVFVENDVPYIEIGRAIERLGGSATYDARRKVLSIVLMAAGPLVTPAPFDPQLPQVTPSAIFTPVSPRPTPQPIVSSAPRPRRTAIPAAPSQPVPPAVEPTDPRRSRF